MNDTFEKVLKKLRHNMAIAELRIQNKDYTGAKLSYNSILYLDIIETHDGEYTASNLADMLHVARPSVTQKLNELEKQGYIYKTQSQTDKRVYYLHINNDIYSKEIDAAYDRAQAAILEKLQKSYTKEELSKFYHMLDTIGDVVLKELL